MYLRSEPLIRYIGEEVNINLSFNVSLPKSNQPLCMGVQGQTSNFYWCQGQAKISTSLYSECFLHRHEYHQVQGSGSVCHRLPNGLMPATFSTLSALALPPQANLLTCTCLSFPTSRTVAIFITAEKHHQAAVTSISGSEMPEYVLTWHKSVYLQMKMYSIVMNIVYYRLLALSI